MTAHDHRMQSIRRGAVTCTCGWLEDGDLTVDDTISALMAHAYESGHADALDNVTDAPEDWRKLIEDADADAVVLPVIVYGDPNDRSTWVSKDGTPVSLDFDPGRRGWLIIPPELRPE